MSEKIIVITSTIEFHNRAFFEAINRNYRKVDVIVIANIRNLFKVKAKNHTSQYMNISNRFTVLPQRVLGNKLFRFAELFIINRRLNNFINNYDIILFANYNNAHLLDAVRTKKIIYLMNDPYLLMSNRKSYEQEKQLIDQADIILCTSDSLRSEYLSKYFNSSSDNAYYWPNTVDLNIWNYEKLKKCQHSQSRISIGHAGNLNEITCDLDLVDEMTDEYSEYSFEFAGRINFKDKTKSDRIKRILTKSNIKYLGLLPYAEIPYIVINWDICLMLDVNGTISKYVHHNKLYQYLSCGKPIVAKRTHNEYDTLKDAVLLSDSNKEFVRNIDKAKDLINDKNHMNKCLELARLNSSDARSVQFAEILEKSLPSGGEQAT